MPLYYACLRHDFNWRNLHRIAHEVNPRVDSWNDDSRERSDFQFRNDLTFLCEMTSAIATRSPYFTWHFDNTDDMKECRDKSHVLFDVVYNWPEYLIGPSYGHSYE